MREIKFRAWLPTIEKMCEPLDIESWTKVNPQYSKMIWLEFTGLLDKNGKEIYEGDIISYETYWKKDHNTKSKLLKVAYIAEPPFAGFQLVFMLNNNNAGDMMNVTRQGKIIGNIYENPELLNQSTLSNQNLNYTNMNPKEKLDEQTQEQQPAEESNDANTNTAVEAGNETESSEASSEASNAGEGDE